MLSNGANGQVEYRDAGGWTGRFKLVLVMTGLVSALFGGATTAVAIGAKVASFATQDDVEHAAAESEVRDAELDDRIDNLEMQYGRIDERLRSIQRAVGAGE